MRTIERATQFKKDYKRELKGPHRAILNVEFQAVATLLATNTPLPPHYCDHPLTGNLKGFRDCQIRPDLVLIYQLPDEETLRLVRIGSHSELGI
jgi:mRNA interferase YafQ